MKNWITLLLIIYSLPVSVPANGQFRPLPYAAAGSVYFQHFDSLPLSGTFPLTGKGPHHFSTSPFVPPRLSGWFFLQIAGSSGQANFYAGSGSSATHGIISTGITNHNDRSLGSLSTSGGAYAFGLILVNQTSQTLNTLEVAALIKQWRRGGSGRKNNWLMRLKTGTWEGIDTSGSRAFPTGNFSSLHSGMGTSALNGNLIENQQTLSFQLEGITWKPGEQLMMWWVDPDEPGNDDVCSLDGFSFKADRVVKLPWTDTLRTDAISPTTADLSSKVNPRGSSTRTAWEYDTTAAFDFPLSIPGSPAELSALSDTVPVQGHLSQLIPAKKYFVRLLATNEAGSVISEPFSFNTPELPPDIVVLSQKMIAPDKAEITLTIQNLGNTQPEMSGLQWSLYADFSNWASVNLPQPKNDTLKISLAQLPALSKIYIRGYLIINNRVYTGKTFLLQTPVHIKNFSLKSAPVSADSIIYYELELSHPLPELNASHFLLIAKGITGAKIQSLKKSGNKITLSVHTGVGEGTISLQLHSFSTDSLQIFGTPIMANGIVTIDKSPPEIKKISYRNKSYKIGDTVDIVIEIVPDTGRVELVLASWAGLQASSWKRLNDSMVVSTVVIPSGNIIIPALSPIPLQIKLRDCLGNTGEIINYSVWQDNDPVDTQSPVIEQINASAGIYAAGDTIRWELRFSEKVVLTTQDRKPYLLITIGNVNRQAGLRWSDHQRLVFEYVVKTGDSDADGITWKNSVTLNGSRLSDEAGNPAQLDWSINAPLPIIVVDGIAPQLKQVIYPPPGLYKKGDLISFSLLASEPIFVAGSQDSILLPIRLQSKTFCLELKSRNDSMLHFQYRVQSGDWDKKGIQAQPLIIGKDTRLTDIAGNLLSTEIKQAIINTGIFIDATAPYFISPGDTTLEFCASDTLITLSGWTDFSDQEPGESILLETKVFSSSDSIPVSGLTFLSNGSLIQPAVSFKRKAMTAASRDDIRLVLSDGIHSQTKWIAIQYLPEIQNNLIIPPKVSCVGLPPAPLIATTPTGGNNTYQYLWEKAPYPQANFSRAGNQDTLSDFLPTVIFDSVYLRRKVISGACTNYSPGVLLPVMGKGLWLGKYSSEWNLADNWCLQQVPLADLDVVISGGIPFQPTIRTTAYCRSLSIIDSASLLLLGSLQINGNLCAQSGAMEGTEGRLVFSGEEAQLISGWTFKKNQLAEVIIRNKRGVTIEDSLFINRSILLQSGNILVKGKLQLGAKAAIGPSSEGSGIYGQVGVSYVIPGKKRQYHLSAHPFSHRIGLSQLTTDIDITGDRNADSGFANSPLQRPSAFKLTRSNQDSSGHPLNWQAFTSLNGREPNGWERNEGIRWLFRGKKGEGLDDETGWLQKNQQLLQEEIIIQLKGELNGGDQTIVFPDSSEGFKLAGNPFLSKIDLRSLVLSDSIAPVYWKWNPLQGISGGFTCNSFDLPDSILPFETLLVNLRGRKNEHQITFPEKSKISLAHPLNESYNPNKTPSLTIEWWKDSIFMDRVIIRDNKKSLADFDEWDGIKISNPSHDLFTTTYSGQKLSFDQRPFNVQTKINLGTENGDKGNYQIYIVRNNWVEEYGWQLYDQYTGKWWPMNRDTIIPFSINQDTLSSSRTRFTIVSPWTNSFDLNSRMQPLLRIWPVPAKDILYIGSLRWPKSPVVVSFFSTEGRLVKNLKLPIPESAVMEIKIDDLLPGIYQVVINDREQHFYATGRWIKQ